MASDDFDDLDGLVHAENRYVDGRGQLYYSREAGGYVEIPDDVDAAIAEAMAELTAASESAGELVALSAGDDDDDDLPEPIGPGSALVATGGDAAAVKLRMAETRSKIVRARQTVAQATKKVKVLAAIKKEQLDQLTAELQRVVGPLQEQVELLEEGIWTINLYTGRDEGITVLQEGERAPVTEELAVRQMVLFMDEESLAALDAGGVDFSNVAKFDEWLLADPAHIEQVIPHRKGVVVLEPRRTTFKHYDNPFEEMAANRANSQSYWLIRNGDCLYRMTTDIQVGQVLVPTADEFTSFFERTEFDWTTRENKTVHLKPGTDAWMKAEKAAGARQRHFMRVALIMQGLCDRSTVFHPVPDDLSFLEPGSYDAGHVRVVTDAEHQLGTGSESFFDWLRDRNEQLRIGMRVIGAFGSAYSDRHGEGRVSPAGAGDPASLVLHRLEQSARQGGFKFLFERRSSWRSFEKRASYTVFADDKFVLPFDLVTVEEMEWYLTSRSERHQYLTMVPLLRAAIAAKHAEAETEAPMRQMLAGVIARENGVSVADAEEAVPELVDWYKLANRWHRPLVTDDPDELAKATRMIVAEHAAIIGAEVDHEAEAKMLARLRTQHPDAVLIARRRDGYYVTYVPQKAGTPWVHEYQTSPTGRSSKDAEWQLIGLRFRKWRPLHTSPAWETWDHYTTNRDLLTDPELEAMTTEIVERYADDEDHGLLSIRLERTRYYGEHRDRSRLVINLVERPFQAVIADNLLSERSTGPEHTRHAVRWERTRTGEVVMGDELRDYNSSHGKDGADLYENLPLINEVKAEETRLADAEKLTADMRSRARSAVASIHAQWEAFAEAAHYARFLEDFMDPDLWEGHRKTIKIQRYPHPRSGKDPLFALVESVIEHGFDVSGRTVQEVIDLHRAHIGPHTTPGDWGPRVDGVAHWDENLVKVHDVTEGVRTDILGMVFNTDGHAEG